MGKNRKRLSILTAEMMIFSCLGMNGGMSVEAAEEKDNSTFELGMPEVQLNLTNKDGTVVGFDGQEYWVVGNGADGVNPVENNITLLHKQEDAPEAGVENLHYGWSNIRAYVYLTVDGSNIPGEQGNVDDSQFPEFQTYEGVRLVLYRHIDGSLVHPNFYDGTDDMSRALYFAVDADAPEGEKGYTNPIDYHGSTMQANMELAASRLAPKENALITPRTIDLGNGGGKPTENQKFWNLSETEFDMIQKGAADYFEYYWLLAPISNVDYLLPVAVTDMEPPMKYPNSLHDAYDEGNGLLGQQCPVRPAFNLKTDSIIFTTHSSGNGIKSTQILNDLANLQNAGDLVPQRGETIKFTVKDDSQHIKDIYDQPIHAYLGMPVEIPYEGATTGKNQFVSCFIKDAQNNIKWYGKLTDCSDASKENGTITVNVPEEFVTGEYILCLYSEEDNGVNYTDFASEFVEVPFVVSEKTYTVTYTDGVEKEEIFKDQTFTELKKGDRTPVFNGIPKREGYKFIGWTPNVKDIVTEDTVYTAQWKKLTPTEKPTKPSDYIPKTGDNTNMFIWQLLTIVSGMFLIVLTVYSKTKRNKKCKQR